MRLALYVSRHFVKLALVATLVLTSILEVMDLVDKAEDVLEQGQGASGILFYVWLRLPTLLSYALPIGVLTGAVVGLALLARSSELVAMRAAGRSGWNLFGMIVPGVLVFAVAHWALISKAAPANETRLALWWAQGLDRDIDDPKPVWLRVGDAVVSFDRISNRGRKLFNLRVTERDSNKLAIGRTIAAEARYEDRRWILRDAVHTSWTRDAFNVKTKADGPWETSMTPADTLAALTPRGQVSSSAAQAVLAGQRVASAPLTFYETVLQRIYAAPIGVLVMALLAMPAAFINWRDVRSGLYAAFGLAAGLVFLVSDALLTTLGHGGLLPPMVAAWTGVILFGTIGAVVLMRFERMPPTIPPDETQNAGLRA